MAAGGEAARILPGLQGLDDLAGRHSHTPERAPQGPGRPGCLRREVKDKNQTPCPHCRIHLHEVQTQKVLCCPEAEALVGLRGAEGCGLCRGPTDAFAQAHGAHTSGVCKVQQATHRGRKQLCLQWAQLSASKGQ